MQLVLASVHALLAVFVLCVYIYDPQVVPWVERGLYDVRWSPTGGMRTQQVVRTGTVSFVSALVAFPALTALSHLVRGSVPHGPTWLFVEYAVTATIMMYLLAISCGVGNFESLCLLLVMVAAVMVQGILADRARQRGDLVGARIAHLTGWALLTAAWFPLMRSFWSVSDSGVELPPEIKALPYVLYAFFSCFGLIQSAALLGYYKGTGAYDVLSLAAKTTLLGLVSGGFFFRPRNSSESSNSTSSSSESSSNGSSSSTSTSSSTSSSNGSSSSTSSTSSSSSSGSGG